jgi:hypothetical protein
MEKNTIEKKVIMEISDARAVDEAGDHNSNFIRKRTGRLRSIHISGDRFIIKEEGPVQSYQGYKPQEKELPGVYFKGIQYYDLKDIHFINNTGIANLIDLLKSLLENNVEVRFVNVSDKIKTKIKSMGLDHILICS